MPLWPLPEDVFEGPLGSLGELAEFHIWQGRAWGRRLDSTGAWANMLKARPGAGQGRAGQGGACRKLRLIWGQKHALPHIAALA